MKKISIIGMGYVGTAMATLVASTKVKKKYKFFVTGVEKLNPKGKEIANSINQGKLPFEIGDKLFKNNFYYATKIKKNFLCSNSLESIKKSKIIIISINCDLKNKNDLNVDIDQFLKSISEIARYMDQNALMIVESTIPPGTCEKKIYPMINKIFKQRRLKRKKVLLAYTYERVMPGNNYLNSIKNYWRVLSGIDKESVYKCKRFLKEIINTKKYPLTELNNIRSCELGKILENSYRSVNIAFIEEWARFAEMINIDIYKVIESIRLRPTHSNIRHPGFGVGGYCLTKDPLFGEYSAKRIWKYKNLKFPFSNLSLSINENMPLVTLQKIKKIFKNNLNNKKILIMGMSYKENVGDLRSSPSLFFLKKCIKKNIRLFWNDPFIKKLDNKKLIKIDNFNNFSKFDLVLFAVKHKEYNKIRFTKSSTKNTIIFDANYVLSKKQIEEINNNKIKFYSIGR